MVELGGLAPLPPQFPATLTVERVVTAQALVAFVGNQYSVPPGLAGTTVTVKHRLGQPVLDIATAGGTGLACHHRAVDGAGAVIRPGCTNQWVCHGYSCEGHGEMRRR